MRVLSRAVKRMEHAGEAIPMPFKSWRDAGIDFWRGDLGMIAGPAGVGKSTVALTIGVQAKIPTLYFSADSSLATQSLRIIAMTSGVPFKIISDRFEEQGPAFWDDPWVNEHVANGAHIKWNFNPSPNFDTFDEECAVFNEVMGEPPGLIIIDNAFDFDFDSGDENQSLRQLAIQLKKTSRELNASVILLHHIAPSYVYTSPCPPLNALHGRISQTPSVVVTLEQSTDGYLMAAAAKVRNGAMDRHGMRPIYMDYAPEVMRVGDLKA